MTSTSTRLLLNKLQDISSIRGNKNTQLHKLELLKEIQHKEIHAPYLLIRLHSLLLYIRAFPDNADLYGISCSMLESFQERISHLNITNKRALDDSGIAGTQVNYEYSYISALWLAEEFSEHLLLDWEAYHAPEKLDELVQLFINRSEQQVFDDGVLHTQEWFKLASGSAAGSELSWLFMQCINTGSAERLIEQIYNSAEVPIVWSLADHYGSKTRNRILQKKTNYRSLQMRAQPANVKKEIVRPMRNIVHLSPGQAEAVVNSVRAALLVRNREVYAMQYPNLDEIYVAAAGKGIQIVFLGVQPQRRLNLEANYGYMIFSNGIAIGYGGVTPLFRQANTGINIFDEYRKGESAFLYVQVLRMAYSLFKCSRFVVNPYQFGADNSEALQSGAFWFYYRLGFRPVEKESRALAKKEYKKLQTRKNYRTPLSKLKLLAAGDIHLCLPGERDSHFFAEEWLGKLAAGATHMIAQQNYAKRPSAISDMSKAVKRILAIKNMRVWSEQERQAFIHLVPVIALIEDLDKWTEREKKQLVGIIRAKGANTEREYARLSYRHERLRTSLRGFCIKQGKD